MKKKSLVQAILLVLSVAGWAVYDYLRLPAYNLRSFETWIAAGAALAAIVLVFGLFGTAKKAVPAALIAFAIVSAVAFALRLGDLEFWPGNAARLAAQLEPDEKTSGDFSDDFAADPSNREDEGPFILPSVAEEEADRLAAEKTGELGTQYVLGSAYSSDLLARSEGRWRALRVIPIEFSGEWQALAGGAKGTPGFVEVDLEGGTARLVGVEGGLKYGPGAILAYDLMRHVRFKERTALLGDFHFEIDDSGKPRWIVQILKHETGLFGGADADGVAIVDASTGSVDRYREGEEPDWVDRVLSSDQAARKAANGARIKNAWAKEKFGGKKTVLAVSQGYGRILSRSSAGARAWISAGISKAGAADGALLGMALIDLKGKRARLYAMGGIDELKAMEAAQSEEGSKGKGLTASWPLIASISGRPAYFMVMRNSAERRYAFVDYATGTKVSVADTVAAARSLAKAAMGGGPGTVAAPVQEIEPSAGTPQAAETPPSAETPQAKDARTASPDPGQGAIVKITVLRVKESEGNALFIAQGDPDTLYVAPIGLSNGVRFLKPGDHVELRYRLSADGKERGVIELKNLSLD